MNETRLQKAAQIVFGLTGKAQWQWPEKARQALDYMRELPDTKKDFEHGVNRILKQLGYDPVNME